MQSSPLSLASTWDLVAEDYTVEVAPAFEYFAREALRLAAVAPGMRIVDVAAGPGTLSLLAAQLGAEVEALDFAPRMLEALRARAEQGLVAAAARLHATLGDGMALPYPDGHFDAGFSMFGLMFFPDRGAGFRELGRVLKPGARAAITSWAPMDSNPLLSASVAALTELTMPPAGASTPPALPLGSPESCRQEMAAAGFADVVVHELVGSTQHPSTAAMVASFGRSSAPFALTKQRLGPAWTDVERELTRRLESRFGKGAQTLQMPAYLTVGVRP
jgi:ubiquinone/menaquinone biosynthesis C-methylase UbiE